MPSSTDVRGTCLTKRLAAARGTWVLEDEAADVQ
jgi:hypothetical protein